jgi:hypothetical protein
LDSGIESAALTPLENVKAETIAWATRMFLDLVSREALECADMSAL